MIEESNKNLHKFKFEYDDSEESQYVRKLYGEKYLLETNIEKKMQLENWIVKLYQQIEITTANHERYKQLKSKQIILSDDDINKVKDIIRDNFKGQKRWTDGTEFCNDEDFLNKELGKIMYNINRPRLGYTGKTHYGPLHSYSYENLNKLFAIFGRKFSIFKWILDA
jgi:hypothetical protein